MFVQLAIGGVLLLLSIVIAGSSFWVLEWRIARLRPWLMTAPHQPKLIIVLCMAAAWVLVQMTLAVWLWALVMLALGIFDALEPAMYFALVAFTTLGFVDVLLPVEWRFLG